MNNFSHVPHLDEKKSHEDLGGVLSLKKNLQENIETDDKMRDSFYQKYRALHDQLKQILSSDDLHLSSDHLSSIISIVSVFWSEWVGGRIDTTTHRLQDRVTRVLSRSSPTVDIHQMIHRLLAEDLRFLEKRRPF